MDAALRDHSFAILHERSRRHLAEDCAGWLSIKCMFGGAAHYQTGEGRYRVDASSYLILNHQQRYTVEIDAPASVESFCVFFQESDASDILRTLVTPMDQLLGTPRGVAAQPVRFFEKIYQHDDILSPILMRMRRISSSQGHTAVSELSARVVLERLLHRHRALGRQIEMLPAVRAATRVELFQRLHIARDYMHAAFAEPLTLEDVSTIACLSKHHFLRSFHSLFGETPHRYLTRLRLQEAERRLRSTQDAVSVICLDVGFTSFPSFSALFRRHYGASPTEYRIRNFR
jgi:AraC family transcriptional regulator